MKKCCANCKFKFDLKILDYSNGGCRHSDADGFICMNFEDEGIAMHMIGLDENTGSCEAYSSRKKEIIQALLEHMKKKEKDEQDTECTS